MASSKFLAGAYFGVWMLRVAPPQGPRFRWIEHVSRTMVQRDAWGWRQGPSYRNPLSSLDLSVEAVHKNVDGGPPPGVAVRLSVAGGDRAVR